MKHIDLYFDFLDYLYNKNKIEFIIRKNIFLPPLGFIIFDKPKSASLSIPSFFIKIFAGFKSLK